MEFVVVILAVLAFILVLAKVTRKAGSGRSSSAENFSFSAKCLVNKSEARALEALDAATVQVFGDRARVFVQVSYGEFLQGSTRSAHAKINAKRADFVIADPDGQVICVVEYQGAGHYGRNESEKQRAMQSDEIKRAALGMARIPLVEIPARFTADSVRRQLAKAA